MSIVMVSSKTKEEILTGIKALLVVEASTPENLKAVKEAAESVVKHCQEQATKIMEIQAKVEAMEDFDQDEKDALLATRLKKAGLTLEQEAVPTIEQVMEYKMAQLVSESTVVATYEKWAGIFGLESKKSLGRPAAGGNKVEARFDGQWSRELTNGVLCVNYRLLTEEQKQRYDLKNANQWVLKHYSEKKDGDKVQVIVAEYINNIIIASKMLLGQSTSQSNNSIWTEGKELTAGQIAYI